MVKCFLGIFGHSKGAKTNKFLKSGLESGANCGLPWLRSLWLFWELVGAFAMIVHQHTKIAAFLPFGAIAFLHPFNKSVLRAFWGGLFGFIGWGCIFDWLRCFAWLVGLYACRVKRLRTEKRIAANFFSSCGSCSRFGCGLSCCRLDYFAPVVCGFRLGCCFFFPFGWLRQKERAQSIFASSLVLLWVFYSVGQILVQLLKNSVAVDLACSNSFGRYSQLMQQESEGLPVLTLIRSGIMSI